MPTKEEILFQIIRAGLVLDYSGSQPEGTVGNTPAGDAKAQHDLLARLAGGLRLPVSVNSRAKSVALDVKGILDFAAEVGLEVAVGAHDVLPHTNPVGLESAGARFVIFPAGVGQTQLPNLKTAYIGGGQTLQEWLGQHERCAGPVIFPGANLYPANYLGTLWPLTHRRIPMGVSGPIVPEDLRKASAAGLADRAIELQQAIQPYVDGGALFILNGWPIKQGDLKESRHKCQVYSRAIHEARAAAPSPVWGMYDVIARADSLQDVVSRLHGTQTPLAFGL
jgi:hypothetical protein